MAGKNINQDYTGFPGNCSPHQLLVLDDFRNIVIKMNLFKAVIDQVNTPQNQIGDQFLLRFLRARNFDLNKAKAMFDAFIEWRKKNHVDTILKDFLLQELSEVKHFYPHGYYHTDKLGRPIYIERIGQLKLQQLFQITTEERLIKYYIQSYEILLSRIFPSCSKVIGKRIDQTLTILDLKGSTMKMMSKQVYNFIKLASSVAQDNYPEILGKMFIINAPMLFSGVWAVIKPWLDEKTKNKIAILGSSYKEKLKEYINEEDLPDFLGGTCKDAIEENPGPWNPTGKLPLFPGETGYKENSNENEEEEKIDDKIILNKWDNDEEQEQEEQEDEDEEENYTQLKLALQGLNLGQPQNKQQSQKNQKYEFNTQGAQIPITSDTPLNTQIDADDEN